MSDHVDGDVAPAAGAVLTTAQAVGMAEFIAAGGRCVQQDGEWLSRTILAWEPVVRAAEAWCGVKEELDAYDANPDDDYSLERSLTDSVSRTEFALEDAVRAMRAAGGGA